MSTSRLACWHNQVQCIPHALDEGDCLPHTRSAQQNLVRRLHRLYSILLRLFGIMLHQLHSFTANLRLGSRTSFVHTCKALPPNSSNSRGPQTLTAAASIRNPLRCICKAAAGLTQVRTAARPTSQPKKAGAAAKPSAAAGDQPWWAWFCLLRGHQPQQRHTFRVIFNLNY